jgi:DNA-binding FadR family transcriptional regulator
MSNFKLPKASELIAKDLREKIIKGELKKGSFLPNEAQLMQDFGISRPTLREALRILESEGLIEISRGSRTGAKINGTNRNNSTRHLSRLFQAEKVTILDLYEARYAFETTALQNFFLNVDSARLKHFRQAAEGLRKLVEQEKFAEFPKQMAKFHQDIVACGKNKTTCILYRILLDMIVAHQLDFQHRFNQSRETLRKRFGAGYRSCVKLINLIEEGKFDDALEHWQLHLKNVAQGWTIRDENSRIINGFD